MRIKGITILFLSILSIACTNKDHSANETDQSIFVKVEEIPDSALVVNKVYHAQPKIWNDLYGVLFDSEMFTTTQGMVKWNREIFNEKRDSIESRVNALLDLKFDSTLQASLEGFIELTGRRPENVRLSIILAPVEGIGFGGIENDAFVLDLLDNNFDVKNMVQEGIPHEFNHFIYEPTRENDPNRDTPLRLTIDEGFACYYIYKYFDGKISKAQAVEQMTEKDS